MQKLILILTIWILSSYTPDITCSETTQFTYCPDLKCANMLPCPSHRVFWIGYSVLDFRNKRATLPEQNEGVLDISDDNETISVRSDKAPQYYLLFKYPKDTNSFLWKLLAASHGKKVMHHWDEQKNEGLLACPPHQYREACIETSR